MHNEPAFNVWVDDGDLIYPSVEEAGAHWRAVLEYALKDHARPDRALLVDGGTLVTMGAIRDMCGEIDAVDLLGRKPPQDDAEATFEDDLNAVAGREYDAVFAMSNILVGLPGEAAQIEFLKTALTHLKARDGVLVISLHDYGNAMSEERRDLISPVTKFGADDGWLYFVRRSWTEKKMGPAHTCQYHFLAPDGVSHRALSMQHYAITPAQLTTLLRDVGFEEIDWFSPAEVSFHQSVCLAFAKRREATPRKGLMVGDSGKPRPQRFIVWDGDPAHQERLSEALADETMLTSIHHTHLIDRHEDRLRSEGALKEVGTVVEGLQARHGDFSFSQSFMERADLIVKCEPALAQAYFAAQGMMSAKLTSNDQLMFLPDLGNDRRDCLELIKLISRCEENLPSLR